MPPQGRSKVATRKGLKSKQETCITPQQGLQEEIILKIACIAKISVMSPTVIDVPTIELLTGEAKSSFV